MRSPIASSTIWHSNLQEIRILHNQQIKELEEGCSRETDNVVVVSFDFANEYTTEALEMVISSTNR
jgi:hypothetical protein